jgi:GT2 family glycosyltransferase
MPESNRKVGVCIVNFNAGALLVDTVGAVLAAGVPVEVVVSDNASSDDSLTRLREHYGEDSRLTIVENASNLGFARGNNVALQYTAAPYLLILNPDCVPAKDALAKMLAFMEASPDVGMTGCVVRDPDGAEQVASRRVIPDPWIGLARLLHLEVLWPDALGDRRLDRTHDPLPEKPVRVEAISGAFMLVRREALEEVGLMDEGYFLHCEDLDWFVRFRRAGWHIYLVPDADAVHYKGFCSVGRPISVLWHKHRGMVRFFRKFQFQDYPVPLSFLVIVGIWLHFGLVAPAAWIRRQFGRWTA